jgi:hypothetical protein
MNIKKNLSAFIYFWDMQSLFIKISIGAFILANILATLWFFYERDFEPLITSLLIFAAIMGLFIDQWISKKEKRKELLEGLSHELYINMNILKDSVFSLSPEENSRFVIFPRLESSAVNSMITSSYFFGVKDKNLCRQLFNWREKTQQFNQRLTLTEMACLLNPSPQNISLWRNGLASGIVFTQIKTSYDEIIQVLLNKYSSESGIDKNTTFFE